AYADLDHALRIDGYDVGEEDVKLSFDVDRQAVFVMDEEETQIAPYDRQFASKSTGKRAMQLFAGPMTNLVLAIVIFFILGLIHGVLMKEAMIDKVEPRSPAAEAGFKHGDEVISVDGTPISTWDAFTDILQESPEKELTVTLLR